MGVFSPRGFCVRPTPAAKPALSFSKKSFHDAVDRNRAKRILREGFRLVAPQLAVDADWVLVGRASLRGKRTADVMDELRYVARKGGFLLKTEEPV